MFNFPNDFLQDSFLVGLAIITMIVFGCKNVRTVHMAICFISLQLLPISHIHYSPILLALLCSLICCQFHSWSVMCSIAHCAVMLQKHTQFSHEQNMFRRHCFKLSNDSRLSESYLQTCSQKCLGVPNVHKILWLK
jgi:hypothetical protein